jgi:hypothetical protein
VIKGNLSSFHQWNVFVISSWKANLGQILHFYFYFWHKWKEFIAKTNKNNKPLEWEEHHHVFGTLIDEAPLRPIITSPNKTTYFNTNNVVPTPALIKLLGKFFFCLKSFF